VGGRATATTPLVWDLRELTSIGGHVPEVLGAPASVIEQGHKALRFDGLDDGVFLPVNPIEGWNEFTIEVLFKPDGEGPAEQRFLHIQDDQERRVLIETRVTKLRTWALDTFLRATDSDKLTLLDPAKVSPGDQWYWVALIYDGKTMSHYVNGNQQLAGAVTFPIMSAGRISLGVRQNRIHWFKGCISQVRFTPGALRPAALQREP
jgi:hypothetical protein